MTTAVGSPSSSRPSLCAVYFAQVSRFWRFSIIGRFWRERKKISLSTLLGQSTLFSLYFLRPIKAGKYLIYVSLMLQLDNPHHE